MEEPKVKKNSKWLVILLGLLGVAIIVLIVAIITINNNLGNSGDVGGGLQALEINDDITDKIYGVEDYSADDAIEEYEREISFGSNEKRVYLIIDYANFVYDEYEDIESAIEIIERAEPLLDGVSMTTDYYAAVAGLYERAGYAEQAKSYNQKVDEMTPEVRPEMRKPEGVEEPAEEIIEEEIEE